MGYRLRLSIFFLALGLSVVFARYGFMPIMVLASSETAVETLPPLVTVRDATPEQMERLGEAMAAFDEAGLELPALEIWFPDDRDSCGGSHGGFRASEDVMQIRICSSENDWVYVHELAHAWERANVTDEQRDAFVDLFGLEQWRDHDLPWNERGVELAAVVIQQGLTGLPLPPVLSTETVSRLEAFELLTDRVAPTLVSWVETRDVSCDEPPTALSRPLTDASGLSCR